MLKSHSVTLSNLTHLSIYIFSCRLWNELTIKLIRFVKHDDLQNEDSLVALYHNFITSFESK